MQINWTEERNLTMLTDYYEFTMSNGYFLNGMKDRVAVFDMFFRNIPDGGGFAIFAGLEQLVHYLKNLRFTEQDIVYFRSKKISLQPSTSSARSGRGRRALRSSPTSRLSPSAARSFRHSWWRRWCC